MVLPVLLVSYFFMFVSFGFFLLLCWLSHHLQGRVHDSDPMGGDDSDSTVVGPAGPGVFFLPPSVFSFLFV